MYVALIGNQNSGKTTLFNRLTGANQRVGNFPGVTVEQKMGELLHSSGHDVTVVDLPGIYSLSPYTNEEIVSRNFIINNKPAALINIIDATNIERNLYLTMQLIELGMPMIIALNMMDEVTKNQGAIDLQKLTDILGVPVVPISALKKQGLETLTDTLLDTLKNKEVPVHTPYVHTDDLEETLSQINEYIYEYALQKNVPLSFASSKLFERDELMHKKLKLPTTCADCIEECIYRHETAKALDSEAILADSRYQFIEMLCNKCVTKPQESKEYRRSVKIDSVLTHKYLAYPSFVLIIIAIFGAGFGFIGLPLQGIFEDVIDYGITSFANFLIPYGINPILYSLLIDGVFAGIGAVLGFLPLILTLFFFLSILEDCGYMARVTYIMDKPFRSIGLSGRSFVPILMGFGCTVPAILSTRTIPNKKDRHMTIFLAPFMSCSAKIPIYALFTAVFFTNYQVPIMLSLYLLGVGLAILSALFMKNTTFQGESATFVMELPNYRFPSLKTTFILIWQRSKDFIYRAFTVIFLASLVIWMLQSFDYRLHFVTDSGQSVLASLGRVLSVLFYPLGFTDWRISTSLITGFLAKEVVISTLAVLTESSLPELSSNLHTMFTPLSAYAFLIFTLLYTPCVAAIAAVRRELGSLSGTIFIVIYQTAFAWFVAFAFYRIGLFLLR